VSPCEWRRFPRSASAGSTPRWSLGERPLAAPLFVALDLAQDVGRGREILNTWDPPEGWARVW